MTDIMTNYYNLTSIVNSSSLGNLMAGIAPVIGGYYLGIAFLLIIFLVSLLYMKGLGRFLTGACVMGAMSLTMVSSLFLFAMGMISVGIMWFMIFTWIAVLFYLAFKGA
jgi:asparagine N-glycosylation enzyme membrane subunit Stt3